MWWAFTSPDSGEGVDDTASRREAHENSHPGRCHPPVRPRGLELNACTNCSSTVCRWRPSVTMRQPEPDLLLGSSMALHRLVQFSPQSAAGTVSRTVSHA